MGKQNATTGRKARPLLISFDNPQTAEHYITNAKHLRNSENVTVCDHVFINKDLAKAQAAYELRCRRRAAAAQCRSNNGHQSSSSSTAPMPLKRRNKKQLRCHKYLVIDRVGVTLMIVLLRFQLYIL